MPLRVRLAFLLAAALVAVDARADGLRIGTSINALQYDGATLYVTNVSARVARGRASLTFGVPLLAFSGGGRVVGNGDQLAVVDDGSPPPGAMTFGLGDMSMALDYNLIQNREKMFVVALGGNMRFPTTDPQRGLSAGEIVGGLGLSSYYGLTRQLFLFADARQSWAFGNVATSSRLGLLEGGAVYWLTEGLGFTASVVWASYGSMGDGKGGTMERAPSSVEFNAGLLMEALPGMMMNLGGIGGLAGSAPRAGGNLGFGFEL